MNVWIKRTTAFCNARDIQVYAENQCLGAIATIAIIGYASDLCNEVNHTSAQLLNFSMNTNKLNELARCGWISIVYSKYMNDIDTECLSNGVAINRIGAREPFSVLIL